MPRFSVVPVLALACLSGFVATAQAKPADGDNDGLPDRWERRHNLAVNAPSGRSDPDRDRLSNRREYRVRTNPRRADTDRDGLSDRAEVNRYRTNPRKADTDGDGLSDGAEIKRYRTNPRKADTDGDGFKDGAEVRTRKNPRDPLSRPPASPGSAAPSPAPAPPAPPTPGGAGRFPTPESTGVPAAWVPAQTRSSDLVVTQPGAVVQDVLLQNADVIVAAPNVTLRRVKLQGGEINNFQGSTCQNGLTVEDTTIEPPPGQNSSTDTEGVISTGGYTARRVKVWRRAEGFRVGGTPACGPVRIENSFAKIAIPSGRCDLHSDGVQGYYGNAISIANVTIDFNEASCGTAPFFVPANQGNTSATVDRLLVMGGGYPFRMGVPGTVSGLKIVDKSWGYGPIAVVCSRVSAWDASIVTMTSDYQVARTVRSQPCNTNGS